jgi:hypothetical protein
MRGRRVGFTYHKLWRTGIIQGVSADFPGYYAVFIVRTTDGSFIPVDSRDIAYL